MPRSWVGNILNLNPIWVIFFAIFLMNLFEFEVGFGKSDDSIRCVKKGEIFFHELNYLRHLDLSDLPFITIHLVPR